MAISPATVAGFYFYSSDNVYKYRIVSFGPTAGGGVSGSVYRVESQLGTGPWVPLCLDVVDGAIVNEALPMRGYFDRAVDSWLDDATKFTFVCRKSAAFKAIAADA